MNDPAAPPATARVALIAAVSGIAGLAYEVGAYRWDSAPEDDDGDGDGDKMTSVTGMYVWVFKKQPYGSWKLAAGMTNTTQPPSGTDTE